MFRIMSGMICPLLLIGCAVNPATKRAELMLVSEEKEFQIGQQVDKNVREEMGIYLELPELRTRVKQLVEKIGRKSDRPDLIYRMEIIDTPDFNAFAVPGGFLYVHRGLLERINSLDELASVMGHEIAHVAARHSASQISKMQFLNIGLLGVAIATGGGIQDYSSLIDIGGVLAFSKFSRDDEREADDFGVRYMTRAGYNPKTSIDVMTQIQRLHDREPDSLEIWFMTHPPTSERLVSMNKELGVISARDQDILKRVVRRNEYIRLLDGMAVGQWNGKELIKGERYFNKEHFLSIPVPDGWQVQINNKNYTAVFFNPKKESFLYFDIQPLQKRKTTRDYFRELSALLKKKGLRELPEISKSQPLAYGALAGTYEGQSGKLGVIRAQLIAFTRDGNGHSMIGIGQKGSFEKLRPLFEGMINDLKFISNQEASQINPPRMRTHQITAGETWEQITSRYFKSSEGKKRLAEYNGLKVENDPVPGILLKIPPSLHFL
ncbi:M48 family metalloprotease [Thermodesulfobacteriota bacterium]